MKTVYETAIGPDAHVVMGLLRQHGVEARVLGENLGFYAHPIGSVHVVVAPADEIAAVRIIADWEAARPKPAQDPPSRPTPLSRAALMLVIGMALLIAVVWYFTAT